MAQRRMPNRGLFGGFYNRGNAVLKPQSAQPQRAQTNMTPFQEARQRPQQNYQRPSNVIDARNRFAGNQNRPGFGTRLQQTMQRLRSYGSNEGIRQKPAREINRAEIELEIRTRENIKRETNDLKRLCDDNLRGNQDRELADIYKVVLGGIEQGQIRGSRDIEFYFREWFKNLLEMDPGFAQHPMFQKFKNPEQAINYHSNRAAKKFMESFSKKYQGPTLQRIFNNLAQIAIGQDPHE